MSEQRKYRTFTAQQKIEIVLAGMRADRSIKDVCREHEIAELERTLGRKTYELEIAGEALRGWE